MFQNLKQQVKNYRFGLSDIPLIIESILIVLLLAYFFYRSWIAFFVILPLSVPIAISQKQEQLQRNRTEIGHEFRDCILSVSTSQKAGYSIENAFTAAGHDMKNLYGKGSLICMELDRIAKGLGNNIVMEKLLYDMGERSENPDIREFAQVFSVAKRSGGNMTEIMAETIDIIGKRIDVAKEIDVLISAKKMEARIMEIVPFGIIAYVGITNKGFFDPLYNNAAGIMLMSVCFVIYMASCGMIEKIIRIEI